MIYLKLRKSYLKYESKEIVKERKKTEFMPNSHTMEKQVVEILIIT